VAVLRTGILPALLVLVMSICLSTNADARRWKWWHYYSSYERSARSGDDDRRRARASEVAGPSARAGGAALGAIAERLISGCRPQSAELANLPFDTIARIAAPDDAQHAALDALRGTAREAAERFASDCPQSVPAGPAVRLEAMEQAIDAAEAAFNVVEPALAEILFRARRRAEGAPSARHNVRRCGRAHERANSTAIRRAVRSALLPLACLCKR
jgi:hypothetical protein